VIQLKKKKKKENLS